MRSAPAMATQVAVVALGLGALTCGQVKPSWLTSQTNGNCVVVTKVGTEEQDEDEDEVGEVS